MEQKKESKLLSLIDLTGLGMGGAIGSGIFVMLGIAIGMTGHSVVLAVFVGSFMVLFSNFYQVIMSSMFVFKGGDYSARAFLFGPKLTGVSAVFTFISSGFVMSMYGLAIVDYVSMIVPSIMNYQKPIAILIMTVFFAATIKGSKFMSILNNIMMVVLIGSIAIYVAVGSSQVQSGFFGDDFFLNGAGGFFGAIAIMTFACSGASLAPMSQSAVAKNPKKNVPISIFIVTLGLAIVYGLMAFVASGVRPVEEVANQNLSIVAKAIFPNWAYIVFVLGGAVFAIATSLLSGIVALRYPNQQIAEDGWLPAAFKKTTKNGFPWFSQLVFYLLSIIPIIFGFSFQEIISVASVPSLILSLYLNFACIKMVKQYPEQWKKSILHMPRPVFVVIMLLACVADVVIMYNMMAGLGVWDVVKILIGIALIAGFAVLRIKMGAVKPEKLQADKDALIKETLEYDTASEQPATLEMQDQPT